MACCIPAAMVMSELLALWKIGRFILFFVLLISATGGALAFELGCHGDHHDLVTTSDKERVAPRIHYHEN